MGKKELEAGYQVYIEKILKRLNDARKIGVYRITEYSSGNYRIFNCGVHMELLVGTKYALLFDTGHGFGDLRAAVKQITHLPLIVVNSHGHLDHTCGNSWFDGDIYIHPEDMALCRTHNSFELRKAGVEMAKGQIFPGIASLPENFEEDVYCSRGCGNLVGLKEGHVFDLGGKTLEVVELPGHTRGSIGLLYREEKLLFAGDAINGAVWLFLEESLPLSVYMETLQKAQSIDFHNLVMAHDFRMPGKEILKVYLDTARNLDFEQGIPFASPFQGKERDVRQCLRPGYGAMEVFEPGFASIVIERGKLR